MTSKDYLDRTMLAECHGEDIARTSRTGWVWDDVFLALEVEGKPFGKFSFLMDSKLEVQEVGRPFGGKERIWRGGIMGVFAVPCSNKMGNEGVRLLH